ncbi:hypothetical protein KC19_7G134200 [Ceratodon purpureus]|uniref:Uncharacterized protein n=1 Tax=Ceratodon purpureus TaxID=3225 RepID=A0A8T0HB79_CERPU|nr:hypothetical protein KC19_7G134200 [Ceratodon purpureus]
MLSLAAHVLVMLACIHVAGASSFDGLPRPKGFPDAPTTAYGKLPTVYDNARQTVNCAWYGFANVNFPSDIGLQCLAYLWAGVLSEAGQNTLEAYQYLMCYKTGICYDTVWYSYYCKIGCFYLSNSSFAIPPISVPPPVAPPPPITPGPPAITAPPTTPDAFMPPSSNGGTQPPAPPGTPPGIDTAPRLSTGTFHQADVLLVFCTVIALVAVVNIFNWC